MFRLAATSTSCGRSRTTGPTIGELNPCGTQAFDVVGPAAARHRPDSPDALIDDPAQRYAFEMDLHMFVLFGARERVESELTAMITHAGFAVSHIVPTQPERTLVAMAV